MPLVSAAGVWAILLKVLRHPKASVNKRDLTASKYHDRCGHSALHLSAQKQ